MVRTQSQWNFSHRRALRIEAFLQHKSAEMRIAL
jgi:hypothetical protein